MSKLILTVNGERARNLLSLRLKEFDRLIERGNAAVSDLKLYLEHATKIANDRLSAVQQVPVLPDGRRVIGGFESVGVGQITGVRQQLSRCEQQVAGLVSARAQSQWVHDSFEPSKTYEIDAQDMMLLGISPGAGRAVSIIDDPADIIAAGF
jgi:hypothetical protein